MEVLLWIIVLALGLFGGARLADLAYRLSRTEEELRGLRRAMENMANDVELLSSTRKAAGGETATASRPERSGFASVQVENSPKNAWPSLEDLSPEPVELVLDEAPTAPAEKWMPNVSQAPRSVEAAQAEVLPASRVAQSEAPPPPPEPRSELWARIEAEVAGNWIGVGGVLAVVLGVAFLGIYAALQLTPFGRFAVVTAFAGGVFALSRLLERKEFWQRLSSWVRSGSGAIFLLGCLGSVAFDSMRWVESPMAALTVIGTGLAANLALAFFSANDGFASLHVILSLCALALGPQVATTFVLGSVVSAVSVGFVYFRQRWDRHLLLTLVAFFVFHLRWHEAIGSVLGTWSEAILAMGGCLIVALAAALVHYRQAYAKREFDAAPFAAHLVNWVTLGVSLAIEAQGSRLAPGLLLASSVALFFVSNRARDLEIRWLFVTDRVFSLFAVVLACASLHVLGADHVVMTGSVFVATTLFLLIVSSEEEALLYRIAHVAQGLSAAVFLGSTMTNVFQGTYAGFALGALVLAVGMVAAVFKMIAVRGARDGFGFDIELLPGENSRLSLLGLELPFFVLAIWFAIEPALGSQSSWWAIGFVVPGLLLTYGRSIFQDALLDLGSYFVLAILSLLVWHQIGFTSASAAIPNLIADVFLLASALVFSRSALTKSRLLWPAIYLLYGGFLVATTHFLAPISPLLPGVVWLTSTAVVYESARWFANRGGEEPHARVSTYLFVCSLVGLGAFTLNHVFIDLQVKTLLLGFTLPGWIELYAACVVLFLMLSPANLTSRLARVLPWGLEAALLFGVGFVVSQFTVPIHAVAWQLAALGLTFIGLRETRFARLVPYGVFFHWLSLFQIAFISSTYSAPGAKLASQPWFLALFALGLGLVYTVFFHRECKSERLKRIELAPDFKRLQKVLSWLAESGAPLTVYPLTLAAALFFYWSFDKTILSLLWVAECFVLFLLAAVFREGHFRRVSMAGVAAIFLRIVFYDLQGQDFFIKALVFIGVGGTLIAMNSIHAKYRDRFETPKKGDEK